MEKNGYKTKAHAPPDGDCGDPCSPESPLSPLAAASGGGSSSELSGATQLYPMRFVQLALFCLYSLSNAFQWIEYSIVANLVARYYAVDEASVNWTAIVYMVTYVPLIFPAAWLLDRRGLRFVIILGALGTCAGSWVKVLSVHPDRFTLCLVGQTIVAGSQIFILSIPPRLAAVWFSAEEVSRACAVGVFGNQVPVVVRLAALHFLRSRGWFTCSSYTETECIGISCNRLTHWHIGTICWVDVEHFWHRYNFS